jgi:hypothetical protein
LVSSILHTFRYRFSSSMLLELRLYLERWLLNFSLHEISVTFVVLSQDYNQAFDHYVLGDWQVANRLFLKCKKQKPDDVHLNRLMSFMVQISNTSFASFAIFSIMQLQESMNFTRPSTWNGYRLFGRRRFCESDGM